MDAASLEDLFRPIGLVQVKRMFGGFGVYQGGLIFAVVLRGELYLKGDEETRAAYEEAGAKHWVYEHRAKKGVDVAMPYWRMPEEAHEDEDELVKWARLAIGAARRSLLPRKREKVARRSRVG